MYKKLKQQFKKCLKTYDKNALIQDFSARILVDKLASISDKFDTVYEIGSGTGLLTRHLLEKIRYNSYYACDLVGETKDYISKIVPDVKFFCGNALKIKTPYKADLIVSNAVFQWFGDIEKAIEIVCSNLKDNGVLAFTIFDSDNFAQFKKLTGICLDYVPYNLLAQIIGKRFEIVYMEKFVKELEFDSPLQMLIHMKNTGVNSVCERGWTISDIRMFCEECRRKNPKNKLTYSPIVVVARRTKHHA